MNTILATTFDLTSGLSAVFSTRFISIVQFEPMSKEILVDVLDGGASLSFLRRELESHSLTSKNRSIGLHTAANEFLFI